MGRWIPPIGRASDKRLDTAVNGSGTRGSLEGRLETVDLTVAVPVVVVPLVVELEVPLALCLPGSLSGGRIRFSQKC